MLLLQCKVAKKKTEIIFLIDITLTPGVYHSHMLLSFSPSTTVLKRFSIHT